jgi:hypothetical protein
VRALYDIGSLYEEGYGNSVLASWSIQLACTAIVRTRRLSLMRPIPICVYRRVCEPQPMAGV